MIKVKVTLQQDKKARRGNRVQLYYFFNLGARCEWVTNAIPRTL
jgi:hypothetical protein